jgi:hypothetical protein
MDKYKAFSLLAIVENAEGNGNAEKEE